MTSLTFTKQGNLYISNIISPEGVIGLHLVCPQDQLSFTVSIERTIDESSGWASCFSTTVSGPVWEESVSGCSSSLKLRIVCSVQPTTAGYAILQQ